MREEFIYPNDTPVRLDTFLAKKLPEYSRAHIQKAIKNGKVLINNIPAKSSHLLVLNNRINIEIPPIEPLLLTPNNKIKLNIIYEDKDVLVIDKPAGLQVHPGLWREKNTLSNALLAQYPKIKNVGDPIIDPEQVNLRPGLVHRLDKETSGLLIIAKNQTSFLFLKNQFKNREIQKKYIALVEGEITKDADTINRPIGRSISTPAKRVVEGKNSKEAITQFKVIERYKGYTLLEITPKTGRTHQIRVHLAWYGKPIIGDKKYRKNKTPELSRHFLHASELTVLLPNGKKKTFESPLPKELSRYLKSLTNYKGVEKIIV